MSGHDVKVTRLSRHHALAISSDGRLRRERRSGQLRSRLGFDDVPASGGLPRGFLHLRFGRSEQGDGRRPRTRVLSRWNATGHLRNQRRHECRWLRRPCRIELWDWQAGKRTAFGQDKHQAILNHVAFGPTGLWLIGVGGGDGGGALVFWDSATSVPQVVKAKGHLQAFAMDMAKTRLYAVGHGGFQVWAI